jgi:hypothetical protein
MEMNEWKKALKLYKNDCIRFRLKNIHRYYVYTGEHAIDCVRVQNMLVYLLHVICYDSSRHHRKLL